MIVWSATAADQLEELDWYLLERNPDAADDAIYKIHAVIGTLSEFPEIGRPGRVLGTRELVISGSPYLTIYEVKRRNVHLIALLHGAQKCPR